MNAIAAGGKPRAAVVAAAVTAAASDFDALRARSGALRSVFTAFFGAAAGGVTVRPGCDAAAQGVPACPGTIVLRGGGNNGGGGGGGGGNTGVGLSPPFQVACTHCTRGVRLPQGARDLTGVEVTPQPCGNANCAAHGGA